jgi:hypothetical protein
VVLCWPVVWLVTFCVTLASMLVAIACPSLIPRQQMFDTGAARKVRRIGPRAFEAEIHGRLPQKLLGWLRAFSTQEAAKRVNGERLSARFIVATEVALLITIPSATVVFAIIDRVAQERYAYCVLPHYNHREASEIWPSKPTISTLARPFDTTSLARAILRPKETGIRILGLNEKERQSVHAKITGLKLRAGF